MNVDTNERIWSKSFILLFISNFLLFLTYYGLITALPIYVLDELKGNEAQAGLVVTILLASAIIVRPFSGKVLEVFGRKKTLLISLAFFMIATFMYFWTNNYFALIALRFFHGIWFSIITTATGSIAADIVPVKRRGEGVGYFTMSMNLAVIIGPFTALTLLQIANFQTIFLLFGILMVVAILITSGVNVPKIEINLASVKKKLGFDDLFEKRSIPISLMGGLVAFAYSSILSFISIFAHSIGLLESASYFFLFYAASMILARPFVGRLFDTKGPEIVVYPTLLLFSLGLFTLTITNSAWLLLLSAILIGIGYGSLIPCLQTLAIQFAGKNRSGHATATFFTFFDTGVALGAYILGIIASQFSFQTLYFVTGVSVALIMVLYKFLNKSYQKNVEEAYNEPVRINIK
ncbi:MFS transporter [Calidifontibacillus erzurumensis]|uniref:MFS transporter n=1 Tax=Calidifontibacillus erzurumensis TaxID=2741433 RepID=A0A8J8GBX7_9BACI|nr:MFS transporter [Calidifontibacillus erzurumensis]NSL50852.1 MFS transporter [Calidifontibacillus erzurumensis]